MVLIPHDVWVHIARFLPDDVLRCLVAVNSTFHHLAFNVRYREVTVDNLGCAKTARKLYRLRDPYISQRIRYLNIYLENYEYLPDQSRRMRKEREKKKSPWRSFDELIRILAEVIKGLPNVIAFHVFAIDSQLSSRSTPIFTAAWKTFGANLQKIGLGGEIWKFPDPFFSIPQKFPNLLSVPLAHFPKLRELQMKFTDVTNPDIVPAINTRLCNTIAPAFNRLSPALESLSLSIDSNRIYNGRLDLSDFFSHLDLVPGLKSLTVHLPQRKVSVPIPVKRLLLAHTSTLRHLDLKLNGSDGVMESHLLPLMTDLLSDDTLFVGLESFKFSPTLTPVFTIMTTYLARSADTLTSLELVDRYLTHDDVKMLVDVFLRGTPCLLSLALNVEFFNPYLLSLLAASFRGLQQLELRCLNWGVESGQYDENSCRRSGVFSMEMEKHRNVLMDWGVLDIVIELSMRHYKRYLSDAVASAVARCIPSAQCSCRFEFMLDLY